jgi:hypothetical protein
MMRSEIGQLWYFTYPDMRRESIILICEIDPDDSSSWIVIIREGEMMRMTSWAKEFFENPRRTSSRAILKRMA